MAAIKQWLVDPAHPDTAMYITNNPEVAAKRAAKGDFVQELERAGQAASNPDYRPYYRRVGQPTKPEEDEL
jgi:hypothetical protein